MHRVEEDGGRGAGGARCGRRAAPLALLALLALLLAAAPLAAQAGSVRGRVSSEEAGEPLRAAVVEVLGGPRSRAVATDRAGGYVLPDVPAGRQLLRVSHLGYAPLEVEVLVPSGREVVLDVMLRVRPVALEPVRVAGEAGRYGVDTMAIADAELGLAGARVLEATPGLAELGLTDAAQGIPGQRPVDPSDVLYVRGAAADLKLVYLDGAPVYAPFPLGGLLDAFTPELLRSADVYLGGAPARYDGGLSYVLDLRTRGVRSDAPHSSGAVDMLGARGLLELPLPGHAGLLLSGRAVHGLATASPLPYDYTEGLLRSDVKVGAEGELRLTGFHNQEKVWLEGSGAPDSTIVWGNSAGSLRYRGRVAATEVELTAALGGFSARLPLQGQRPILAEGTARRARLAADLARRFDALALRYGVAYDHQAQSYRAELRDTTTAPAPTWTEAAGEVVGVYADVAWQAGRRLRLRGGLRADQFSLGPQLVLAPRAAVTWLLTERAALTVAGGRYHQYLRAPEAALLEASSSASLSAQGTVTPLTLGHATHFAVSLAQDLGEGVRLGVEGYFKDFRGMPGSSSAEASASGMDLWMRRNEGVWTGWLGYSLAWVWSSPSPERSQFAGRHLLSAGLGAPLGGIAELDLRFAYGAGLPYAAIPIPTTSGDWGRSFADEMTPATNGSADAPPLLPAPERPFIRLDLAASRTWHPTIGGTRMEVGSYLKLLNTLGRRDALFYRFDREHDDRPRALAALPLVPVLGVEWKF